VGSGNRSDFSHCEPLAGALPTKEIAHHPAGAYMAMETSQMPPALGIWETATGSPVWTEAGALALAWTPDGSELLLVREDRPSRIPKALAEAPDGYTFERRLWPQDDLASSCPLRLPFSAWPVDIWVASTGTLAAVRWMDQGASGWEPMLLRRRGDAHLLGAGFELASEVGVYAHPTLSPDGRFAVSGYQTTYKTLPTGTRTPLVRGRFEVGRVVVIDIPAGTSRDIVLDDAVPAKLHGTAARWGEVPVFWNTEHFELLLPTGAKRIYSTKA